MRGANAQPSSAPARAGATATVDEAAVRAAGIRKHEGARLTLYTDLGDDAACASLVRAFDAAYPQWCNYFQVPEDTTPAWHVTGHLMLDREKFRTAGLLPAELPDFRHGYTLHDRFWLDEQPSEYYRRHLLLHEGTHSFMFTRLGGCGPAWYMEGVAELLATHRVDDAGLHLGHFPRNREEVPMLGRIKLVRDDVSRGRLPLPPELLNLAPSDNNGYAWAWAWAAFLDGQPYYRERFRALTTQVNAADFNRRFQEAFGDDLNEIALTWPAFASELEHGRDIARSAITLAPGRPLGAAPERATVATDRGWQSSGVRVEAGKRYKLRAKGRYQLAAGPPVWWCQPGGVTIRYHEGSPLGILQGAIVPDRPGPIAPGRVEETGLLAPVAIGLAATFVPTIDGTLYLRVNDSPAELSDNRGTLEVEIANE